MRFVIDYRDLRANQPRTYVLDLAACDIVKGMTERESAIEHAHHEIANLLGHDQFEIEIGDNDNDNDSDDSDDTDDSVSVSVSIVWDTTDPNDEGWSWRVRIDDRHESGPAESLSDAVEACASYGAPTTIDEYALDPEGAYVWSS